jgi:Ca-activated chloride channel family protein
VFIPRLDLRSIEFGDPQLLWLLVLPGLLLCVWLWRLLARRADARRLRERRTVPIQDRLAVLGDLPFWLCLILASALLVLALARPHGPAIALRQGGIDLVILQDASASMRVRDVTGDRWQRSMRFLRVLGDSLSWKSDRIALAVFARIAAPQIRLTKDPNTFFFFLDHLERQPPFRIEEESTWDTNLELGIHWGIRLVERDEELHGPSQNAHIFLMLSDGEAWSGEVADSLERAVERGIPVFAIGVGTLAGGRMPEYTPGPNEMADSEVPTHSRLDRDGMQQIAAAGGARYFELDRDTDRDIANAIVDYGKRIAPTVGVTEEVEELYWRFLSLAALVGAVGLVFLRERTELWLLFAAAAVIFVGSTAILGL